MANDKSGLCVRCGKDWNYHSGVRYPLPGGTGWSTIDVWTPQPLALQPFKSIDEIKVGMRVVPIGGIDGQIQAGPGVVIRMGDDLFEMRSDKNTTHVWGFVHYWAPESPIAPATLRSPLTSDDSERIAVFNFFKTPLSDNTCAKCGAPKGCKYHE